MLPFFSSSSSSVPLYGLYLLPNIPSSSAYRPLHNHDDEDGRTDHIPRKDEPSDTIQGAPPLLHLLLLLLLLLSPPVTPPPPPNSPSTYYTHPPTGIFWANKREKGIMVY